MPAKLYCSILWLLLSAFAAGAQNIVPVLFDLKTPVDVNIDADGNLWTTEAGVGANDGQVIRLNTDGSLDTIITALPSFFNFELNELQGALSARLEADGRIIVMQGAGTDTASASVLIFDLADYQQKGAALTIAERRERIPFGAWALSQGYAETNPYSMVFDEAGNFIIADAAANAIFKYEPGTGIFSVVADLPSFPNPLPFGPPFIQPVPTKILAHPAGGWLVSTLTGFPFVDGAAKVFHIQPDGEISVFADKLSLITDMEYDPHDGQLVVQQFARFGPVDTTLSFIFGSAQTIKINSSGARDTVLAGFGPSPGMALSENGSIYVTHLFLGQLLKADAVLSSAEEPMLKVGSATIFPNPSNGVFSTLLNLSTSTDLQYRLYDQAGRLLRGRKLGHFSAGSNRIDINFTDMALPSGLYTVWLSGKEQAFTARLVVR